MAPIDGVDHFRGGSCHSSPLCARWSASWGQGTLTGCAPPSDMGLSASGDWLTRRLKLPHTAEHGVDDPETTIQRRRIVQEKRFLRRVYLDWYDAIAKGLPAGPEPVLELGAGAGFLQQHIPNVIASDILCLPGIDFVADGSRLPLRSGSLRAIVMTNVLHHIPDVGAFLGESARCVRPGGALVMIEPWVSRWSRLVYGRFHTEPFDPHALDWVLPPGGPLSGANVALPWIVFARDRTTFEQRFPTWRITSIEPMMPFRYLLSGGVSLRSLVPSGTYQWWDSVEQLLSPWMSQWGMFARIVVTRTGQPS